MDEKVMSRPRYYSLETTSRHGTMRSIPRAGMRETADQAIERGSANDWWPGVKNQRPVSSCGRWVWWVVS